MAAATWEELVAKLGPQGYVGDGSDEAAEPEDGEPELQEFDVWIRVTGSIRTTVEAKNYDDAVSEAWKLARSGDAGDPDDWDIDDVEVTP